MHLIAADATSGKYLFLDQALCLQRVHIFLRPGLESGRTAASLFEEGALLAEQAMGGIA